MIEAHNEKLLNALRDLPDTMAQHSCRRLKDAEESLQQSIYLELEKKHNLPLGSLSRELPGLLDRLLIRMDTSPLDCAKALYVEGDLDKAEAEALRAKNWALEAPTPQFDDAMVALQFAALSARAQLRYAQAVEHTEAIVGLTSRERDALKWAWAQLELATNMDNLGSYSESEPIYRQALAEYIRASGEEDEQVLSIRFNLAHGLEVQEKFAEAAEEYRAILAIRIRVQGLENPKTLSSRADLACDLCAQGRYVEAEKEHRAVLAIRLQTLGPEHEDVIASRDGVANVLQSQGKYAEAQAEHRAILSFRTRVLGPDHPLTLWTAYNLAIDLYEQHDLPEARKFARLAYDEAKRTFGPDERYVKTYEEFWLKVKPAQEVPEEEK